MTTPTPRTWPLRRGHVVAAVLAGVLVSLVVPLASSSPNASAARTKGVIAAVAGENQYANVLSQIGGRYVAVTSILNNPNTDPHTFEASPRVAESIAAAQLVVQNGAGYDGFMNSVEAASPNASRRVIVAQHVLGLKDSTPNPHLWYDPKTMPAVAAVMAKDLTALEPTHATYFAARLRVFDASLQPWLSAIAAFKTKYNHTPVAVTEPVADDLLKAMGAKVLTPFVFQADIMNGVDPSPEDITLEDDLLTKHDVKVFCYNEQVIDSLTTSMRATATSAHVAVVGVYETMPTPGFDYQTWMEAEVAAIQRAVATGVSTGKL